MRLRSMTAAACASPLVWLLPGLRAATGLKALPAAAAAAVLLLQHDPADASDPTTASRLLDCNSLHLVQLHCYSQCN
jgi:hypothetical protein